MKTIKIENLEVPNFNLQDLSENQAKKISGGLATLSPDPEPPKPPKPPKPHPLWLFI